MVTTGEIKVTWLGHAATRIDTGDGKVILIDPFIQGNPVTPEDQKRLDRVDLILISHGHGDNMGDAVGIAQQHEPFIITQNEICIYLTSKGVKNCSGGNTGGTQEWNGNRVTMVEAIHSSSIEDNGQLIYAGLAVGFVIEFPDGFTVYHAGDTAVFEGMKLIARLYSPDLALLPIGDYYTMGPKQAAEAVRLLDVSRVIPIHYGTFPALTGTAEAFQQEAQDVSGLTIFPLQPGESVTQSQLT